jgi:hypothetical protein
MVQILIYDIAAAVVVRIPETKVRISLISTALL